MSDKLSRDVWIKRCAVQFESRAALARSDAMQFAEAAYQDAPGFFDDDPEGAADEEMSRWNDGEVR